MPSAPKGSIAEYHFGRNFHFLAIIFKKSFGLIVH